MKVLSNEFEPVSARTVSRFDNDFIQFIQRNTTIMTLDLLHMARMLKTNGGKLRNHGKAGTSGRQGAGSFTKALSTRLERRREVRPLSNGPKSDGVFGLR